MNGKPDVFHRLKPSRVAGCAVAFRKRRMLDGKRQGSIGASMRVVAGQAALGTGFDPPVRLRQCSRRCVVALSTQSDIALAGRAVLGGMGVMTPAAFAIDRRCVSDTIAPIAVHFVAVDAQTGLLANLEVGLPIAVGMMADCAVCMGLGGIRFDTVFSVAVDAQFAGAAGKEKGLAAAVGQMAQITATFCERLVPVGKLALGLDGSVTFGAGVRPAPAEQVLEVCPVRVVTGRTIS